MRVPTAAGDTKPLIPAVAELTAICNASVSALGANYVSAWDAVEKNIRDSAQDPHIENILSRLRMMLSAIGPSDKLAGLDKSEIENMEKCVRTTIAKVVNPKMDSVPDDFPHRRLAQWLARSSRRQPVEIFTLNYDVLLEAGLEAERIPVFDGFVGSYRPFFHPDSLRRPEIAPGANWVRLWKMHGSITWKMINHSGSSRVVRGEPGPDGEMIYPSFRKYDESRQQPFSAFTDRLARVLDQDGAILIVAGFSFGDEHINNLIFSALENRPRTHVYSLHYSDPPQDSEIVKRALKRPNILVVGNRTGIIGGRKALWNPDESAVLPNGEFEVKDETPAAGGDPVKVGLVKIGDFARLTEFLRSMNAE